MGTTEEGWILLKTGCLKELVNTFFNKKLYYEYYAMDVQFTGLGLPDLKGLFIGPELVLKINAKYR